MKRNSLLLLLVAGAAVAIVTLLLLSGGEPASRGTRGEARHGDAAPEAGGGGGQPRERFVQEVTPEDARLRSPKISGAVRPGMREPFDSEETLAAQRQYAGRIEELLREMIDPRLSIDQRMARKRELVELLRLMGHRVSPAVRQQLLEMLGTVEPKWRAQIADAIGSLEGDAETAHALVEMLKATPDDIYTRQAIFGALGMMNVEEVTPALFSLIGEGLPDEEMVVRTLGKLAKAEQFDRLFGLLDKPLRSQTRSEIENVLRDNARSPVFLDKVAAALDGADPAKRRSLLRILAVSTNPAHAEKVRTLLGTETDQESRALAITALGRYGDLASARLLLEIAQAGPAGDQQRAVQAMFTITNAETVDALAESYGRLGTDGRRALMGAMARIPNPTEKMTKTAREEGLADPEMPVRSQAARVLGRRGQDENVEALANFLRRAQHPSEVAAALNSLEEIRTPKAAAAAIDALGAVPNERQRERWRERFLKMADQLRPIDDVR